MSRTAQSITLPVLLLMGLATCGSNDADSNSSTETATTDETEAPVAAETDPVAEAVSTDAPDYPDREVKPEDEWASNFFTADEMGATSSDLHFFDPYEFHPIVSWEPSDTEELYEAEITAVCGKDQLYNGIWYLDQPVEQFTNYASEETNLDDVVVQYNARDSRDGMDVIVNILVTCDSWAYMVDTYGINQNISPNQVLLSEEIAYSIADIDALAEREIRDSHEYNPIDIRDTERVHQIYYRFAVPSV